MSRRARVLVLAGLVVAAAAFGWLDVRRRARLDRGPKHHHTDVTVYLAASQALEEGTDPYEARSPRGWRYVYPPLLAALLVPLLRLPVPDAALVLYAVSLLSLAAAWRSVARTIGPGGARAAALALLFVLPFLVQTLQRGQVTILLLATVAGATALLVRSRDLAAGVVLALGGAIRLTPLLLAGMFALACLRSLRGRGLAALRFPAGLALGTLLWFLVVPAALLGPARALDVTSRWLERTREVFAGGPGGLAELDEIDEFRFKNQGVRRVVAAWTGAGPEDSSRLETVDLVATGVAVATLLLAALVGWALPADRGAARWRAVAAVGALLPVFATRYAWPTHFVLAMPLVAVALAGRRERAARLALVAFGAGTLLFYAGHLPAFRVLAERGVLCVGAAVAVAAVLLGRGSPEAAALSPRPPG